MKVWATRAGSTIHVVVINKRLAQPEVLHLRIAAAQGAATVEQLRAPSVNATSGVTGNDMPIAWRTVRSVARPASI